MIVIQFSAGYFTQGPPFFIYDISSLYFDYSKEDITKTFIIFFGKKAIWKKIGMEKIGGKQSLGSLHE